MTRRGHRHLGIKSNTRCPAPQLRSGINVDEETLNEKAPLVNGPGRRKAADHRVGVAGDGRRWLRRRKSLCLSTINRYASNSPSVCSASNASSPLPLSRSIFPSWSERRPRASMTWSSARARAISASSSMADMLAAGGHPPTRGLESGGPRQFRTHSGGLAMLAATRASEMLSQSRIFGDVRGGQAGRRSLGSGSGPGLKGAIDASSIGPLSCSTVRDDPAKAKKTAISPAATTTPAPRPTVPGESIAKPIAVLPAPSAWAPSVRGGPKTTRTEF
jgi:hypothetical protein